MLALIFVGMLLGSPALSFAAGEILVTHAPDEIVEGEDLVFFVSASPRDSLIQRAVVVDIPAGWAIERAYAVESNASVSYALAPASGIKSYFRKESGREHFAFADTAEVWGDVKGVAYFFVLRSKALPAGQSSALVRATLVERIDPQAPPEIDKKTKKEKPRNMDWRMVTPIRDDFAWSALPKKQIQNVRMIKGWRSGRSLILEGEFGAAADLRIRPESLQEYLGSPFSIEFWYRSSTPQQSLLTFFAADGSGGLLFRTNLLGQLALQSFAEGRRKNLAGIRAILTDGAWHHVALSIDSQSALRMFVDGTLSGTSTVDRRVFAATGSISLGDATHQQNCEIDELRLVRGAYRDPSEFVTATVRSARDTLSTAFALFHLDEFGRTARSSVPLLVRTAENEKPQRFAIQLILDSNARLDETSSPVQTDQVLLAADLTSPTKVSFGWRSTSELGVKEYILERRVGSFGAFEEVMRVPAKNSLKVAKRGETFIRRTNYSMVEELPKLNGDIELFYRVAVIDYHDSANYSEPVKLEYGADREVFVEQNDPNPFNPTTTIAFRVIRPSAVRLAVYDIIGRELMILANGKFEVGRHKFVLDATNWPGGIYFYKVKTPKTTITRKMVLAK